MFKLAHHGQGNIPRSKHRDCGWGALLGCSHWGFARHDMKESEGECDKCECFGTRACDIMYGNALDTGGWLKQFVNCVTRCEDGNIFERWQWHWQWHCGGTMMLADVALVCVGTDSISQKFKTDSETTGIRKWRVGQCCWKPHIASWKIQKKWEPIRISPDRKHSKDHSRETYQTKNEFRRVID
jgi:hypothetical protein